MSGKAAAEERLDHFAEIRAERDLFDGKHTRQPAMNFRFPVLIALALINLVAGAQQQPAAANTQQSQAIEKTKPAEEPDDLHINSVTSLAEAREVLARAEKIYPDDNTRRLAMAMVVAVEFETSEGNTTGETTAL